MGNTPRKAGTYYDKTREARVAYQREYYQKKKFEISRKNELQKILDPESYARRAERARECQNRHQEKKRAARQQQQQNPES